MIKKTLKRLARTLGINVCSTDHLGVEVELDLARLTANDPLRTIFDVGSNYGQTALRFASAFPDANVFAFEPVPESFRRLEEAVGRQPRIKPVNTALGASSGTMLMNLTAHAGANTLLPTRDSTNCISVPITTIDAFVAANAIDSIDLLKMDVEGYEVKVLEGAERTLERGLIRYVFSECVFSPDSASPHASFFEIHQRLEKSGFCFVAFYGEAFVLKDGSSLGNALYALRSKLPSKAAGRISNIL